MADAPETAAEGGAAIAAALALDGQADKIKGFYRAWAERYDRDLLDEAYVGHAFLADFLKALDPAGFAVDPHAPDLAILDAGCGTGLVGAALAERGYRRLEGIDLSEEMAEVARRTGAYAVVHGGVDLCQGLPLYADGRFDAVLSCGVFTLGHVPPSALRALARVTRPGGVLAVSTRASYYDQTDFEAEATAMAVEGLITLVQAARDAPYVGTDTAHYWAFRRSG